MGTSTIFKRVNDLRQDLASMSKEDLEKMDKLNPWGEENVYVHGWTAEMELHNGNVHPLIWWYGRLMHLRDAPKLLTGKYYSRYAGKRLRSSEWTLLKAHLEQELERLDKEYKRDRARSYREREKSQKR